MRVGPAAAVQMRSVSIDHVIGRAAHAAPTLTRAGLLAKLDAPILLVAEPGAGADALARAFHEQGPRRNGPFISVDCAGLRQHTDPAHKVGDAAGQRMTLLQSVLAARGGTLFLHEISELSFEQQSYLLRTLGRGGEPHAENAPWRSHFRLIAATSSDLREEVRAGRFRNELLYRAAVTSVRIPPLRDRPEDLPALVEHFSAAIAAQLGYAPKRFAPEVLEVFRSHTWPGNLRELCEVVEAMVMNSEGGEIGLGTLPPEWVGATVCRAS